MSRPVPPRAAKAAARARVHLAGARRDLSAAKKAAARSLDPEQDELVDDAVTRCVLAVRRCAGAADRATNYARMGKVANAESALTDAAREARAAKRAAGLAAREARG